MNRNLISVLYLVTAFSSLPVFAGDLEPVLAGAGKVKFGGLFQTWAVNDTTVPGGKFNFRLRRAQLKFGGSITDGTRWYVMADPAKNLNFAAGADGKILQDLILAFSLSPRLELSVGQFKKPTTPEGLDSSAALYFPERSMLARTWGDTREPGAMLTYKDETARGMLAITNGQGANRDDTNNPKDLHLRAEVDATKAFRLGAFTTASDFSYAQKARWGFNARFNEDDFFARFDVARAQDNGVRSLGMVADLGYSLSAELQPVARYEFLDNGVFKGKIGTIGLNYYLAKNASKIQAAYSYLTDVKGTSGAGSYGSYALSPGAKGSLIILAFQAAL